MTATLTATDYSPRAWVGCLGCYNAGNLNGSWLDLDELEDDDTLQAICPRPDHEELWVMDHENMATSDEMSPFEAAKRGRALQGVIDAANEYGVPVAVALEYIADTNITDPDCWPIIGKDVTVISADSETDYVAQYLEEFAGLPDLPYWLNIDYAGTFEDLTGGCPKYRHEGTLYVFDE